jgi:shikimate kinase
MNATIPGKSTAHRIILIGFSGCGKSTVAELLGQRLMYQTVDLDKQVEMVYLQQNELHLSSREIFDTYGSAYFGSLQLQTLQELDQEQHLIIATGGGAMAVPGIRDNIRKLGHVCYLQTSAEAIYQRLMIRGFPLFLQSEPTLANVKKHWEQRHTEYTAAADSIIESSSLTAEQTVKAILSCIKPILSKDTA